MTMPTPARWSRFEGALILLLLGVLIATVPLFVCLPPHLDNDIYGIAGRIIRHGGVVERDLRFFVPPGFALVRAAIDTVGRGHHEVLKIVDLLVLAACIALLEAWWRPVMSRPWRLLLVFILTGMYLSTPEACHIQPDPWLFLPTLIALHLRRRQFARLTAGGTAPLALAGWAFFEGLFCAAACLVKPQAVVPMLALWGCSTLLALIARPRNWWRAGLDLIVVVAGGGMSLILWFAWLKLGGGWPSFAEAISTWGSKYYANASPTILRPPALVMMLPPWTFVHLWAVPLALGILVSGLWAARKRPDTPEFNARRHEVLFAAFYLGWTYQETFMQVCWLYHVIPPTMLALTFLINRLERARASLRRSIAVGALVTAAIALNPLLLPKRLIWWPTCWTEGSSPRVRDALGNIPFYPSELAEWVGISEQLQRIGVNDNVPIPQTHDRMFMVDWQDLARVEQFLREQGVKDRELTCYHSVLSTLFLRMDRDPSARVIWFDTDVSWFPDREPELRAMLTASSQRFIVTDLQRPMKALPVPLNPDRSLELPEGFPAHWRDRYPWSEPIVFRAGRYAVHRVTGSVTRLTGVSPDRH